MNEHLTITDAVILNLINQIETVPLHFGEIKLEDHPDFPMHNRYMRILGIDTKAYTEYAQILYTQIGKHKDTGVETILPLECPEFALYKDTWSYLKKPDGISTYTGEIIEGSNEIDNKVRVPSVKYMVFLSNQGRSITQLLMGHLPTFKAAVGERLDKVKGI